MASTSSSTVSSGTIYDVFLSFRCADTRPNFISHLFAALRRESIKTFFDDKLGIGDEISSSFLQTIKQSKMSVIVFSEYYASSRRCLEELAYIMECKVNMGQIVLPIFYLVDPSDVRKQSGTFGEGFRMVKEEFKNNLDLVQKWSTALNEAGDLSGWDSRNYRNESNLIEKVASYIVELCPRTLPGLFGIDSHLEQMISLLRLDPATDDVHAVGIWGMGGIGKTTIAECIFDRISYKFERFCFFRDVREKAEKFGEFHLLKSFYSELLGVETTKGIEMACVVPPFIECLSEMKVLVVLDDVNDRRLLDVLLSKVRYGPGSRIIVTSRDKQVLLCGVDVMYKMEELDHNNALKLFSMTAFKEMHPPKEYEGLLGRIVDYAGGVPLALKVLGSNLLRKKPEEWGTLLEKLRSSGDQNIQEILRISYDNLTQFEKDIFLDIACFFNGDDRDWVEGVLDCRLDILADKSLIIIVHNTIRMHNLIQELGQDIARKEGSRLFKPEDILQMSGTYVNPHVDRMISRTPMQEVPQQSFSKYQGEGQRFDKLRPYTLENLSSKTTAKLVRCPRCKQILPEMPNVPVYQCGRCGTLIQGQVSEDKETGISSQVKLHSVDYERDQIESSDNYIDKLALVNLPDDEDEGDQSGYKDLESQQLEVVNVSSDDQESGSDKNDSDICDSEQLMGDGNSSNLEKFKYGFLKDDKTKKCARNCALFCDNQKISRESLIDSWISDGLISSYQESNEVLQTLINGGLLKSTEDGKFVELQERDRLALLEHIFPPIEGRIFLLRGSMGLTELPKDVEWEMFREICLMDNELSELPENLKCPNLQALFLQRNFKLRRIPPLFFSHMPALQVLNLSRTRIKSLPESLFGLINLKRLFLNHCDLLMTLSPRIGELKHLEVLDLDGTEITDLPKEVCSLTNLTHLELSFCEPMPRSGSKQSGIMIPPQVFSVLSKLEELSIDVSSDDKRWDECVEALLRDICALKTLISLKFYFPQVELLRHFEWIGKPMIDPPLDYFRFSIGCNAERIISRVPRSVEYELEKWDRCLKYTNGRGEFVHTDIKELLRHATAFFLERHMTVKNLSEFGHENMKQLKCCVVGKCNKLEAIIGSEALFCLKSLEYLYIYYMKSLKSIWQERVNNSGFSSLKSLILCSCAELINIFTPELVATLPSLEELTVDDCPKITSIVSFQSTDHSFTSILPALRKLSLQFLPELVDIFTPELLGSHPRLEELIINDCPKITILASCTSSEDNTACVLPALKKMLIHSVPELASISNGLPMSPHMERMSFYYCPKLKSLPISKAFNERLTWIKGELTWWEDLEWDGTQQGCWDGIFVCVECGLKAVSHPKPSFC